jgi:hypothetical protein
MIIKAGQVWQGYITDDELSTVTVLGRSVKCPDILAIKDQEQDIYFMDEDTFLRRFEYKR